MRKFHTIGSLAQKLYVHKQTLIKLIKPISHKIEYLEQKRRYLTFREVDAILEFLGFDKDVLEEKKGWIIVWLSRTSLNNRQ